MRGFREKKEKITAYNVILPQFSFIFTRFSPGISIIGSPLFASAVPLPLMMGMFPKKIAHSHTLSSNLDPLGSYRGTAQQTYAP